MENTTTIRLELEFQAQRLIAQYMLNNERVEKEVEQGIKNAFENIDIEKEVEKSVIKCIETAIRESADWGKIREAVKKKTDMIVENYIEKSIEAFKLNFD